VDDGKSLSTSLFAQVGNFFKVTFNEAKSSTSSVLAVAKHGAIQTVNVMASPEAVNIRKVIEILAFSVI